MELSAINERDHVMEPPNASITVVNYGDYECPDCHRTHREVQKAVDELHQSVRFVYRHFPLVDIHPRALPAAQAAEAAAAQGKFWEMHRRLYLRPDKLKDGDLRRHAREIGLDLERFDLEISNGSYLEQITKDRYHSMINGISGVPTTFVNGVLYSRSGVELIAEVKAILKEQSSRQEFPR